MLCKVTNFQVIFRFTLTEWFLEMHFSANNSCRFYMFLPNDRYYLTSLIFINDEGGYGPQLALGKITVFSHEYGKKLSPST